MKTNVVYVNFGAGREYPYLNDRFELAVGDRVYVDGKLAGLPGTVTEVLTQFKVSLKYYKYVLQKIDYTVKGEFRTAGNYYVTTQNRALPFEQLAAWIKAPEPVGEGEEEEQFLCGDGYEIDLDKLDDEEDYDSAVDPGALWDGQELVDSGRLKFVTVSGGKGAALLQSDKHAATVDFDFDAGNRRMTNVYCDCICPRLCKDMAAVACLLGRMLADGSLPEPDFTLIKRNLFRRVIENNEHTVTF